MNIRAPRSLDAAGRCCGRKPLIYKRPYHHFCDRCDAAYDEDGRQIENWMWKRLNGGFIPAYPASESALKIPPIPEADQ